MILRLEGSTILIADDEAPIRELLYDILAPEGATVRLTGSGKEALAAIEHDEPDVVILDVRMPPPDGLAVLQTLRTKGLDLPVLIITAQDSSTMTIEAMQRGAYDYLGKPFDPDEILHTVQRAVEHRRLTRRVLALERQVTSDPRDILIGRSGALQQVYKLIGRVAGSDATVLITGESGTGKELVAQVLHRSSNRREGPFIAVNCAALPETLLESELFGHEKGSFTGAMARGVGRFEQAQSGTLFLDEIGDMPLEAQTRLLRVLQQGEYTTVGGRTPIRADVRIIAATHRDLRQLTRQGLFREDLFYRLNVVPIRLPPLRERTEDISALVRHFFAQAASEGLPNKTLDQAAMERLRTYRWPGNVRELENLVRRLAALYSQETIGVDAIEAELAEAAPAQPSGEALGEENLGSAAERHLRDYFAAHKGGLPPAGLYDRVLREIEKPLIQLSLSATRGNQLKAAQLLGLNRNTLRKKVRELDIDVARGLK